MTILTTIVGDILTASNTATVTNKTISRANNTLTVRMANDVSGTLPVTNGGTGQTSCFGEGEILIGNTTGNTLTKTTLTAGCNISVTNGNGSITIAYCVPPVYSIYSWGNNCDGSLGDNSTVNKSSPVSVVGGFTDWSEVTSGEQFSLGIRQNGTAWAWGQANNGKLGNNNAAGNVSSPVSVVGGFTDWCQISAGASTGHSLAVRTNGTAWSWGYNSQGALGDNTTAQKSSPVSVVGGFTDWCQMSGGLAFSVALRQNGTAWAWGVNTGGRLGDNTTVDKSSPVSVVGGYTDWCQISAGSNHVLGLRTNGTAWAWGYGSSGPLGNNEAASKLSPVSVVGGFTDWCQVSGGQNDSFGLRTNGTLWAWGSGSYGKLGDGTTTNRSSPVSVIGGFTDWFRIACSIKGNQALAIRASVA